MAYLDNQFRELHEGPLVVVRHHHSETCVGGVGKVGVELVHVPFSYLSFKNDRITLKLLGGYVLHFE